MATVKTDDQNYIAIANAIRSKLGTSAKFTPGEMDDAIRSIYSDVSAIPPRYDRKENEIVSVANSYYTNRLDGNGKSRFAYSWDKTYRNDTFKVGNIDCSSLVGLIIRGIAYANSPYGLAYAAGNSIGDEISNDPDSVTCNPAMNWAINPRDYWCLGSYKTDMDEDDPENPEDDGTVTTIPAQGRTQSAANIAQLLITMGDVVPIESGFDAIHPGDVLFWASKYADGEHAGEYRQPNRFLRISHTAVCVEVAADGTHYYVDSYSSEAPIRKACLETDLPNSDFLVLVIRLRTGKAWERLRITYNPQDRIMHVGETQRFTCFAAGDIVRYQWQFSTDNGITWVNSTLPKMASVAVTATDAQTFDGRMYRCICTDTHGRSITSRNATITIHSAD